MPEGKKILIIDDEVDLCLLLKDYFLRKKYSVEVSHTLSEGEKMFYDIHPDILFLDNNLPDGAGWNCAPVFAQKMPGTYFVLISAFHPSAPEMPPTANYRVIEKPITLAELNDQFASF